MRQYVLKDMALVVTLDGQIATEFVYTTLHRAEQIAAVMGCKAVLLDIFISGVEKRRWIAQLQKGNMQ